MYTFNSITSGRNITTNRLLAEACKELNVKYKELIAEEVDFIQIKQLGKKDLLYRVSMSPLSYNLERYLINKNSTHFYHTYTNAITLPDNVIGATLLHEKASLPIIPTVYTLPTNRKALQEAVHKLEGFPLIIKSIGGSHGIGVMKVDSFEALSSLADYLALNNNQFIMRKFIDYEYHGRFIVLGNKVIDSIRYHKIKSDFRSNVGTTLHVEPYTFDKTCEKTAIKAVKELDIEFGGVDILIDYNGKHYLAEVNFPCFFPRAQLATKTPIAKQMIQYLLKKAPLH